MRYRILGFIALGLFLLAAAGLWVVRQGMSPAAPEAPSAAADDPGFPPLVMAARSGEVEAIGELIRAGADPNLLDSGPNEWTPLLHAVHKNQIGSVRALIAAGADVNRPAPYGLTPLSLAATQGEAEIVEELLAEGADTRSRGSHGWTVLQQALGSGNPRVVEALLRKDPDLRLGNGPRDWAVRAIARLQGDSEILARVDRKEARR
ncbi:MAG TPA: ankyrin repeat domain-containing protein [Thermoanaerobaculia bacterium]